MIEWDESKYIVVSSTLFLLPSVYAYVQHLYVHSCGFGFVTFASINYWKHPQLGFRRDLDVITARSFSTLGILDYMMRTSRIQQLYMMLGSGCMVGLYRMSYHRYHHQLPWVKYHVAFHIMVTLNGLYAIHVLK